VSTADFSCAHVSAEGAGALIASDRGSGQVVGALCERCVLRRARLLLWCALLVRERGGPGGPPTVDLRACSPVVARLTRRLDSSLAVVTRQTIPRRLNRELGLELVLWERELAEHAGVAAAQSCSAGSPTPSWRGRAAGRSSACPRLRPSGWR
jgi:hypothetical protein